MSEAARSRLIPEVDFAVDGRQTGFIRLFHSVHASAYGFIPIPIVVLKNGEGPTALFVSGNHGDEYEGQIAVLKFLNAIEAEQVAGRIIIVPSLNYPAAMAGLRTSPLDDGNLNRAFPGARDGTPTQMIAHYVESVLLPMVQYGLDMHSGGSSLEYVPASLSRWPDDPGQREQILAMHRIFGADVALIAETAQDDRTLSAAGLRSGGLHFACEIGGGGTLTAQSLAVAERGLRNFLAHVGVLRGVAPEKVAPARQMVIGGPDYYVYAPARGLFEPAFRLGERVKAGQTAGFIHFRDEPDRAPRRLEFQRDAMVVCRRVPALVEPGDCICQLASDRPG